MSDEETRNTRELLDVAFVRPVVYVWRGLDRLGPEWVAADPPVGGDSVSIGPIDMRSEDTVYDVTDDDARYIEIRGTAWGDYAGSTYSRSNARVICREYADHVVTLTSSFDFSTLLVRVGVDIPAGLYDAIVQLHGDSCLLDEDDLSELESELEGEDWESWGRHDWSAAIRKLAQVHDADDDVPELADREYVDDLFWDVYRDGDLGYWQAETAVSGVWTDFDRAAEVAWEEIERRRIASLEEWARGLAAPIPGQLALAI